MKIQKGDSLQNKSGDWHEVIKVSGPGYVQTTNGFSIQSRNEGKTKSKIYIFDGQFIDIKSIEEVEKIYDHVIHKQMTPELKEQILDIVMPYPVNNNNEEKEAGYHEAVDNFIKAFDILLNK